MKVLPTLLDLYEIKGNWLPDAVKLPFAGQFSHCRDHVDIEIPSRTDFPPYFGSTLAREGLRRVFNENFDGHPKIQL